MALIRHATQLGHEIVCVTMRYPTEAITEMGVGVIYTGRRAKRSYARDHGQEFDIWIDDAPEWILRDAA